MDRPFEWMRRLLRPRTPGWFVLAACLAWGAFCSVVLTEWPPSFVRWLELKSWDARLCRMRFDFDGCPPVVVVGIDDESFKQLERRPRWSAASRWPWPSSFHVHVTRRILDGGARAVGLDLLTFLGASSAPRPDGDAELAAFLSSPAGRKVVLASKYDVVQGRAGVREEWFFPPSSLRGRALVGYVNVAADADNVVRRFLPRRRRMFVFEERCFASALYEAAFGRKPPASTPFDSSLPPPAGEEAAIAFDASAPVRYVPYWRVLTGEGLDPRAFDGAVVLIGAAFRESHDFAATPISSVLGRHPWGVEIQAAVFRTWFARPAVHRPDPRPRAAVTWVCGLAGALFAACFEGLGGTVLLVSAMFLYLLASWGMMAFGGLCLDVAAPLTCSLCAFVPVLACRLSVEQRRGRRLRRLFSAYVSAEVLELIERDPDAVSLEGERREVTVFFSDIVGFTGISERMDASSLAALLNRYFTPMSEILMRHGGYVDKYVGDAIMAVFGAPLALDDHAVHCCEAALEQIETLERIGPELEESFGVSIDARIGVNTGVVSAGNMGSRDRFEYTVMGDPVNLASRLEGANRWYGTRILVGEDTWKAARERFVFRFVDLLVAKGKGRSVAVYELVGRRGEVPRNVERALRVFEEGWNLYADRRWSEAVERFEDSMKLAGRDDPVCRTFMERCRRFEHDPPPPEWNGEFAPGAK